MFVTPDCYTPPPSMERAVSIATRLVTSRVTSVSRPTVCLADGLGIDTVGVNYRDTVYFLDSDSFMYSVPTTQWSGAAAHTVLHEVIHQIGQHNGVTEDSAWLEEAVTEAVTVDLLPAFQHRLGTGQQSVTPFYQGRVNRVRAASAAATHTSWRSPASRRWRIALLVIPPVQRSIPLG